MVRDPVTVERELGFAYEMPASSGAEHYQQICPRCRRALFGLAQGALWRGATDDRLRQGFGGQEDTSARST